MNVDRRRGWDGARAGVGFEQRIERRRRRRRRWRWRWLPGLSTLARFMARRTTTSTRSPPFPLRHITRQTDALPTTVRKNGSTQGVHLTALFREARLVPKTRAPPHFGSQPVQFRRSGDPSQTRVREEVVPRRFSVYRSKSRSIEDRGGTRSRLADREPSRRKQVIPHTVFCTVPAGFPSSE